MRTVLFIAWRIIRYLPLLLISPFLVLAAVTALAIADLIAAGRKKKPLGADQPCSNRAATVVIPNWNGRDLLENYLPSIIEALRGNPDNEIIVVDNASTDGSVELLQQMFPQVRVLRLDRNFGFGGGSNAGFRAAKNDIVVLLNSDMRVRPDFLQPLLDAFTDPQVFAVACQIFFGDPNRRREETGLTQFWWNTGALRVRHRDDPAVQSLYPCAYPGGGSSAFDRRKFLELGGFDELLAPFYLEDTDLGFMAWKRGWKVLYEPDSIVYHEHRGTIGKRFSQQQIDCVLKKNFLLFAWKNIHEWSRLLDHFFYTFAGSVLSLIFGDSPERTNLAGLWQACRATSAAMRSRIRARELAAHSDTEAFCRPLGGYFRDRFATLPASPDPLRVLFVSPYPICPPVHGGAVFMYQTVHQLAPRTNLNLIILLDHEWERPPHAELEHLANSVEFLFRKESPQKDLASILPHAVSEFADSDVEWLIHRQIYTQQIDVLQIEYTAMAQYGMNFHHIACTLFEHDVYFQSIARQLPEISAPLEQLKAAFEYLRAFHYEIRVLSRFDRVQVCSAENGSYLMEFLPGLASRMDDSFRAGIDTSRYSFQPSGREPFTMLFLGSFRHLPNQVALNWFVADVLPLVLKRCSEARLIVVGSELPARHNLPDLGTAIELRGFVKEVREPLGRYAVFVCPILNGSGMRVKLLEAFASGIPVVSTRLGAEGLATKDGEVCALADDARAFADRILDLFDNFEEATAMACRARRFVVETKDIAGMTERLMESYRAVLTSKRAAGALTAVAPEPASSLF